MSRAAHIMIIAGEPSGDLHGAKLVKALISKNPDVAITGIGGELMAREGMRTFLDIRELSVMGVTEVVRQFMRIKRAFDIFRDRVRETSPDLLILIDYPGFNLKAAQYAKSRSIPTLYYITPKVWAWKKSRLKKIKKYVDHAALIFPFEERIFKEEGIPATFVGHPLLDHYSGASHPAGSGNSSDDKNGDTVIGLLPGSRENEITSLLPVMLESALLIKKEWKDHGARNVKFLVSAAMSVNMQRFGSILESYNSDSVFEVVKGDVRELFRRCDILVAASGTVTLEAAICGIPMVIIYRTSFLTYLLARLFVKIPYVGLPNIIAGYSMVPELLQEKACPEEIAGNVLDMLRPESHKSLMKELAMIPCYLGGEGASERTARIAFRMIRG